MVSASTSTNSTVAPRRAGAPTVDSTGAAVGRWVVRAAARNYTLTRVLQLDPAPRPAEIARGRPLVTARRLLVNDTLVNTARATIGMHLKHSALLMAGSVASVEVPGILNPGMCGTVSRQGT